jgi:hypothetical protein
MQRPSTAPGQAQSQGTASLLTNEFNFVFYCEDPARTPRIFPRSYSDAMGYIRAHRRYEASASLAEARKEAGGVKPRFPAVLGPGVTPK